MANRTQDVRSRLLNLIENAPDGVLTFEFLVAMLWDSCSEAKPSNPNGNIKVHVCHIKKKLTNKTIKSVRAVGYEVLTKSSVA